jgi:hypothetical protein
MHPVDARVVGAEQFAVKLEVLGRVGEDQIDAGLGQARERAQAVIMDDLIEDAFETVAIARAGGRRRRTTNTHERTQG